MRFLLDPAREVPRGARPPVAFFLLFAAILICAQVVMRALSGGLTPAGVNAFYLGTGGEALGQAALWEEVHLNAFLYGFLFLALGSLLVVSKVAPATRTALLWGGFAAALADLFLPFLIVATGGNGALRVLSFLLVNLALALSVVALALSMGGIRGGADAGG